MSLLCLEITGFLVSKHMKKFKEVGANACGIHYFLKEKKKSEILFVLRVEEDELNNEFTRAEAGFVCCRIESVSAKEKLLSNLTTKNF